MKGLGLLTIIRILLLKCVCFLTLDCLRRKTHLNPAPVAVHVLSRIQKSWYRYQKQDFEEAKWIALEASLIDVPEISRYIFIAVHL